jgi:hypothetical protein
VSIETVRCYAESLLADRLSRRRDCIEIKPDQRRDERHEARNVQVLNQRRNDGVASGGITRRSKRKTKPSQETERERERRRRRQFRGPGTAPEETNEEGRTENELPGCRR